MKPLLEIASPELLEKLFKLGNKRIYWESEVVFAEGENCDFLPIVLSGKVKMVRYPEIGKEFIIGFFEKGEVFAIPPAMDGKTFPATCVTVEDTKLLILSRQNFLQLMAESKEFSSFVIEKMCGLMRETAEIINNLANSSPEHRIGHILLRLAKQPPTKINLRRQDIADMTGLTTETTIRTIKKLQEKNLLKIEKGKIIIEKSELLRDYLGLLS
ncbi:MAG: Crp/Fnr family transcriptional regulator [Pyrinomonadaceae bacterium]|jgi:CRP/FNR family transcriptional regulator|nr:Crp/Fnr family transcriptional regulator [Pyrinomonadaceae bacterium]